MRSDVGGEGEVRREEGDDIVSRANPAVILSREDGEGSPRDDAARRSFASLRMTRQPAGTPTRRLPLTLTALALLLFAACTQQTPAPAAAQTTTPTTTSATTAASIAPRVIFPDGYVVNVEVAADDATREQGLMFRDQLAADHGMIFLFPQSGEYPFWMKNTLIPLDMLWIDEGKKIVHVSSNVPPCKADPCPSYPPHANAKYVLELASGVAVKHGLKNGDVLQFVRLENVVAR